MNPYRRSNDAWRRACSISARRFLRALGDPEAVQQTILRRYLRLNANTEFGRRHRFASIDGPEAYRQRVPLTSYDDYRDALVRVRQGRRDVLSADPIVRLVPSSGSTSARKLIPWNLTLQAEFNRGVRPWIDDLFELDPELRDGPAYWSISPALSTADDQSSAVAIGFEDDSEYLGHSSRRLIDTLMVVPSEVRGIDDVDAMRHVQLSYLLRARELRLISVWHPSFLTLLLDPLERFWDRLIEDVAGGTLRPATPIDPELRLALEHGLSADPVRAAELRSIGPADLSAIWPRLGLISCWGDGHAAGALASLRERFHGVRIQPKGLIATEALVSLPNAGSHPVALRSHVFEFLDDHGRSHWAYDLREDFEYSVVITTGGGLYRYRLRDRVRVDGFVGQTPSLRFLGKEDTLSDRCGEKLCDAHVATALREVLWPLELGVSFAMIAPDERMEGTGYTLYLESLREPPADLPRRIDTALSANPHYAYCLRLGQLPPARVFRIDRGAQHAYLDAGRRRGLRLGEIKPLALSPRDGWSGIFSGRYTSG